MAILRGGSWFLRFPFRLRTRIVLKCRGRTVEAKTKVAQQRRPLPNRRSRGCCRVRRVYCLPWLVLGFSDRGVIPIEMLANQIFGLGSDPNCVVAAVGLEAEP